MVIILLIVVLPRLAIAATYNCCSSGISKPTPPPPPPLDLLIISTAPFHLLHHLTPFSLPPLRPLHATTTITTNPASPTVVGSVGNDKLLFGEGSHPLSPPLPTAASLGTILLLPPPIYSVFTC